jgi:hypothetical protein
VVMETTSAQITGIAWNPNENEITLVSWLFFYLYVLMLF